MKTPDDVVAIVRLHQLGWGTRRIARELGIARSTVIHYVREGGWKPYKKPERNKSLDGVEDWLREQFRKHRGNAVVVQRELRREHGLEVALRTVQRAVEPYRRELLAGPRGGRAPLMYQGPPLKRGVADENSRPDPA